MSILLACLACAASSTPAPAPDLEDQANALIGLTASEILRLDVPGEIGLQTLIAIPIEGYEHVLDLRPHSVRSDDHRVFASLADGTLREVDPGPERTVRGELVGDPGSWAAGALLEDGLHARIHTSSGEDYWLEPLVGRVRDAAFGDHVLYASSQVMDRGLTCGLDTSGLHELVVGGGQGPAGESLWVTELAVDCDLQFHNIHGGVQGATNRVNVVINAMNPQYEDELKITHEITTIIVRTSQTYTTNNPSALLNQFKGRWNSDHQNVPRDVAELFTGKNLQGSVIGIATFATVCQTGQAYNVVQHLSGLGCATDLSAHELGHNWAAFHCDCNGFTMNPFLTCANNFQDDLTVPKIQDFRNSLTCLDFTVDGTLLFEDDFESGDFAAGGWTTANLRAKVAGLASFQGAEGANLKKTTWIENSVDTVGFPTVEIEFAHRFRGYEAGDDLKLQYWDGNAWVTVATVADQKWKERYYVLPAFAGDNPDFRFRFRTNAKGKNASTGKKKRTHLDCVRVIGN